MSAPPSTRGQRGGSSTRSGRGISNQSTRSRGSSRGSAAIRGRGRGTSSTGANANARASSPSGEGLLQKLRAGTVKRGADNGTHTPGGGRGAGNATPFTAGSRGRGRGFANKSKTFNTPKSQTSTPGSRAASPVPATHRDFMNSTYTKFQTLKQSREEERAKAIRDGFLADPDKKTSLDKAITPVGTCTDMCPQFERVERIVQNMVDKAEKEHDEETGKDIPAEDRMVKRFRRSAAGYDEQLPSDIRTPATLKRTLDYLLAKVIGGGERLATIQKFVWDRTRGIRNDFSIQQVTNISDVKLAVECFERIARFHILSLHQLSNPDNLLEGEHFDAYQEREQLNNTLLSLMYYYDDHRSRVDFPNEAEFRAYLVILEIQSQRPDMEDRMQSWPSSTLKDERVQTALKLYSAAGNTLESQGPLQRFEPFAIAQCSAGKFWDVLASKSASYIMACLAEIYFAEIRFAALDALWRSGKQGPQAHQAKSRDWSLSDVTNFLGFDTEDQTRDFCNALEVFFATDDNGDEYLDFTANTAKFLDTIRLGSTESEEEQGHPEYDAQDDDQSMFVPETEPATASAGLSTFGTSLNPQASSFTPKFGKSTTPSTFGKPAAEPSFGKPTGSGGLGSTGSSSNNTSAQPRESGFGKASDSGGFGASTASNPFEPKWTFGKTTPTQPKQESTLSNASNPGSFGSSAAPNPVGSTSTFGQAPNSGGFGLSAASHAFEPDWNLGKSTRVQQPQSPTLTLGGFTAPAAPSPSSFGQSAQEQKEKPLGFGGFSATPTSISQSSQPAAPIFGSSFGQTPFAPFAPSAPSTSTSSSAVASQPLFGQTPRPEASLSPAPAPNEDNTAKAQGTTPFNFFQSPSTSAAPLQLWEGKSNSSLFAHPETFNTRSQPAQTPIESFPPKIPAVSSSLVSFAGTTQFPSSESAAIDQTPFKPFLTPEGPLKPSIESSQFPAATTSTSESTVSNPPGGPPFAPTPASPKHQRSTTPPHSPRQPPAKPVFTQADRHKLANNVARIAFTQPKGLLHSYLEFALRDLVTTAFNQHRLELRDAAIASIRERILARKFGYIWRSRAWINSLNRRAKNRRQLFAETIRAEQARKQRSEEELEEILKVTQESRRLQKEVQETAKAQKSINTTQNCVEVVKVAGQKRKSFSGQDPRASTMSSSNAAPSASGHKRSKTMTPSSGPLTSTMARRSAAPNFQTSTSRPPQYVSIFSRTPTLGRSTSNSELRKSASARKLDTTRTDYFRLKAIGVDPDTPIIPDTKETLAIRRQREAEERQASIDRANRRSRTSVSGQSSSASMPPPPLPDARTPDTQQTPSRTSPPAPIEDDFLKQIREAREAMTEQAEWFKQQSVTLEKEMEQQEEFRRSQSSRDAGSPRSSSGLARANGYEYLPAETKPRFNLSRTEQRIRQTGAHGLATKPFRFRPEYVPVAMSKRSALSYTGGPHSNPGRKRSHEDVEAMYQSETAHTTDALPSSKRPRGALNRSQDILHQKPRPMARNGGRNSFQSLQPAAPDDEEAEDFDEEEHDTEELYDEDEEHPGPYLNHHERNGDYADDEDEEEFDDDDDDEDENDYHSGLSPAEGEFEDEEELEDEEGGYQYPAQRLQGRQDEYTDAPTPGTNPQFSRAASSAPGGSADDAFVIDDSD